MGQSITLSTIVSNIGPTNSSSTTLRWYRSTDSTIDSSDTLVASSDVSEMAAGGSDSAVSGAIVVSAGEGVYYGACVEAVSGELFTDNNCSRAAMIEVIAVDLIVASVKPTEDTPALGQSITLSTTWSQISAMSGSSGYHPALVFQSTDSTIDSSDTLLASNYVARYLG